MSAQDYSKLRLAVRYDQRHDYKKIWETIKDEDNWFLRARGLWDENHGDLRRRSGRADTRHAPQEQTPSSEVDV